MITNKVLSERKCKEFNLKCEDIFEKNVVLDSLLLCHCRTDVFVVIQKGRHSHNSKIKK